MRSGGVSDGSNSGWRYTKLSLAIHVNSINSALPPINSVELVLYAIDIDTDITMRPFYFRGSLLLAGNTVVSASFACVLLLLLLLLFDAFSALVANPKNYFTRWPTSLARGLLNRKTIAKRQSLAPHPPPPPPSPPSSCAMHLTYQYLFWHVLVLYCLIYFIVVMFCLVFVFYPLVGAICVFLLVVSCPTDHVPEWQPRILLGISRSTPVAQSAPRNLLTRWDVSSIPANGIFLTKN